MAYTRGWSEIIPAGSDLASTIDDAARNFRVDVRERMDTLLGSGRWATDPIVDWTQVYVIYFPWFGGTIGSSNSAWDALLGETTSFIFLYKSAAGGSITWLLPHVVPVGCTINKIRYDTYVASGTGSTFVGKTFRANAAVPDTVGTQIGTSTVTTGNRQFATPSMSNYTVTTDDLFWSTLTLSPVTTPVNVRLFGVEISYTRPNVQLVY